MKLLELFLGFLRVGCFAFGGAYGALPLIRDVVLSYGWLSEEELSYMIAVSESTPGPIMVNLATFVGSREAGLGGALLATLGVVLPSFVIIILVTAAMKNALKNPYVQALLRGLKPTVIGIVLAMGIWMTAKSTFFPDGALLLDWKAIGITAFLAFLMFGTEPIFKKKISPIALICVAAVCGMVIYGI